MRTVEKLYVGKRVMVMRNMLGAHWPKELHWIHNKQDAMVWAKSRRQQANRCKELAIPVLSLRVIKVHKF